MERQERIRIFSLASAFFCVQACYTILRELRDSLFIALVGKAYIQYAQLGSMLILIPAIFLYSRLVDRYAQHQLVYGYAIFFAVGSLVCAWCIRTMHPVGLAGWILYVFVESYAPFMISLLFAYINSVTPPHSAPQTYALVMLGSKFGGALSAMLSWQFLLMSPYHEEIHHRILLFVAGCWVACVPLCIFYARRILSERYLHGYEASYRVNAHEKKMHEHDPWYARLLTGLTLMGRYPYILGIFGLVCAWEMIHVVINFHRLCVGTEICATTTDLSIFLFKQIFWVHVVGIVVAASVRDCMAWLGERVTLMLAPCLTALLLVGYFMSSWASLVMVCYVLIRAINYSLSVSVREALYIPTTKDVRFKSKSWIDVFGTKAARGSGALYNLGTQIFTRSSIKIASFLVCMGITGLWIVIASVLGKKFESTIRSNQVIGEM